MQQFQGAVNGAIQGAMHGAAAGATHSQMGAAHSQMGHSQMGQSQMSYSTTGHTMTGGTQYSTQTTQVINGQLYNMQGQIIDGEIHHATQGPGTVVGHSYGEQHVVGSHIVGHETGQSRIISTTEHMTEQTHVIGEKITHHRQRVPKKVIREEIVERTIVVPEVIQIEEWIDEEIEVEDKIIEVAKIIQIEKIVEVPEIEIVEKIIEVPEYVIREKIREVPRIETVERVVEVPIIQTVERIVEVPQIEYRDVPVEKIVEVPEILTEEVPREMAIPQYVDRPIEQVHVVEEAYVVERKIPVPVEAETIVEYALPHIRPKYAKRKFPVYLPRFVEVPIARQFADQGMLAAAESYNARVANLTAVKPAVALGEIELLATEIKDADLVNRHSLVTGHRTMKDLYTHAWETGNFEYFGGMTAHGTHVTQHTTTHATHPTLAQTAMGIASHNIAH